MKRFSLLLLACFFTTLLFADSGFGLVNSYAKEKRRPSGFDKTKLFVGGGLGGGSIQGGYIFSVTPSVGYQFTDRFHAGFNLGYFYSKQEIPYVDGSYEKFKTRVISTSLFARFFPLDVVFIQATPELNFSTQKYEEYYALANRKTSETYKNVVPAILVGGGYAQRLGSNSYMMISIMYDVLQNPNSPYYRQPIFGGGLALGLFGG